MDDTAPDLTRKWLLGALLPLALASYGISVLDRGQIVILVRGGGIAVFQHGEAVAWGWLILSAALAAHFTWFWSNSNRLAPYAGLGRAAALLLLIGCAGYLFWNVLVN